MKIESIPIKKETEQNFKKLMDMVQPNDSLALFMQGSPDPDAIASAMALHEIIQRTKGLAKSIFVSTEPLVRQQNAEFVFSMRLNIHLINQVDLNAYRLIALLDAQPSFLSGTLTFIKPQIVFDHHPREGQWQADMEDIRPNYGALSSILTEYLLCARVKIPRNLHTALLYGIKTDTDNFDRDTIFEDISAYTYHTKYANMQLIRRIELNQTPGRFLKYYDHAYHHMNNFRGRTGLLPGECRKRRCLRSGGRFLSSLNRHLLCCCGRNRRVINLSLLFAVTDTGRIAAQLLKGLSDYWVKAAAIEAPREWKSLWKY